MKSSAEQVMSLSESTHFHYVMIEKVLRLMDLLSEFQENSVLRDTLVLKGGTALNLFYFDIPRLSVDIDLNVIGLADPKEMIEKRPKILESLKQVFARSGYSIKKESTEHAGGKWRIGYTDIKGRISNLEVDCNFMLRVPLWPIEKIDSNPLGEFRAYKIPVLDIHELAAGKLSALFSRRKSRDLFDMYHLLQRTDLNDKKLRIAFVVYGALNRKDWRNISLNDISFEEDELIRMLKPVIHSKYKDDFIPFVQTMQTFCREKLSVVLPFKENELAFLGNVIEKGKIIPHLLTEDKELQTNIALNPMLNWKAQNVRKHFNIG